MSAFLVCGSQWRMLAVPMGQAGARLFFTGLDYAGARVAIEAMGITITPDLWRGIQVMEEAARPVLNGS